LQIHVGVAKDVTNVETSRRRWGRGVYELSRG
jgi:hypothetical protein